MELTKEQTAAVQEQAQVIGLIMAYYRKFGDDALQVATEYFVNAGKVIGQNIKRSLNITGTDANAMATVLNAFIIPSSMTGICKVEGNRVIAETDGFCPVMEAVKMLNAPWDKVDVNYTWPAFWGVALAVNPDAKIDVVEARHKGDRSCKHVITIP